MKKTLQIISIPISQAFLKIFWKTEDTEEKSTSKCSHIFDWDAPEVECLISALEMIKKSGPYSIPVNVMHIIKITFTPDQDQVGPLERTCFA